VNNVLSNIIEIFTSHSEKTFEDVMSNGIRLIADAADLNRVAIYKKIKKDQFGQIYLWNKEDGGTSPLDENLKVLPSIPAITQWMGFALNGKSIARRLDNMNKDEVEFSNMFGIKSLVLVPIFTHGEIWGAVTFQDHEKIRDFDDCIDKLNSVANLCANAFIKNEISQNAEALLENVREQNRRLISLSKAKDDFLSRISHEIRTPMNAILGITEVQLRNESLPYATREGLSIIYDSGDALLRIVNDLLDLSKIESQKMDIEPGNYEIASMLCDSVQLNMLQIENKPIKFKLNADENIPFKLFGDELRIKQILNNILSNAFKYTDSGEVSMSVFAEKSEDENSDVSLVFRISDTGQGMTEKQVNMLFSNGSAHLNLVSERLIEGTGLGMTIVWNLVHLMNGNISVESEYGKGSVFTVSIPQKVIDRKILGKEIADNLRKFRISDYSRRKKLQIIHNSMPNGNVLVVDDVVSNIYVTKSFLVPYDLNVETAESGFEAIEKIKSGKVYDVIFMDHMMPKMDGMEATKIIRELGYKHPIVALTANAVAGQAKIFLENGFDGFISKPIDISLLNAELNKFIRNKQTTATAAEPFEINLLPLFAQDAKNALPVFESMLENAATASDEELHLYTIKAHSMKSAFANIGEESFRKLAFELEKAGKEHNRRIIERGTQGLIDALNFFIDKNEREIHEQSKDKDENIAYLSEQLLKIGRACSIYDIEEANAAFENLKTKQWKKETENIINKIYEHILFSDFEEAGLLARSYAEKNNCG